VIRCAGLKGFVCVVIQWDTQIMADQKQWWKVEYFNCLDRMTNDARCIRETESRITTAKESFKTRNSLVTDNFGEETNEMLHLEHSFIWRWNEDTSGSRLKIPWKFWNMVLEKDGDQFDRSYEKWRNVAQKERGNEYPTYNRTKEG